VDDHLVEHERAWFNIRAKRASTVSPLTQTRGRHGACSVSGMPEEKTRRRARRARRRGKAPSTQAGEFVREEIHHVREGKHGARSPKQAIAIGLSKARRAGVPLPPPKRGSTSRKTREQAKRDAAKSRRPRPASRRRSRASARALQREGRSAASPRALARQARSASRRRPRRRRSE
jgi:hypothetical protein